MAAARPILLCYDGSDDARTAVLEATALFPDGDLVVVSFWQPLAQFASRFGVNILDLIQAPESVNEREAALAQRLADEGVELVAQGGASAEGHAVEISTPVDEAIIAHADKLDATMIVIGSRGRSSMASMLLGDVAQRVVQLSNRPVLVVPSAGLAGRRHQSATDSQALAADH